ncbi:MAG: VWA domain-containing protein [Balneolaceae bacterium]
MNFKYFEWNKNLNAKKGAQPFETLWDLFQQLLTIASGDVSQAMRWLTELDKEYGITEQFEDGYSMGDFIDELKERGYIDDEKQNGQLTITKKTERSLRKKSLEEVFKNLEKGGLGSHKTQHTGRGSERQPETRRWSKNDDIGQIDSVNTMLNMLHHSSLDNFELQEDDLEVYETDHYTSVATVLLIDLSHSMILYGEDRITPAKKVAMALSELIMTSYAKDSLDIVAFGNEAWQISVEDLPYLKVGPYHTNTKQGLEVARHILQRKKFANKQIFMITDGKPSCMIENGKLYKNSFGLDRKIVNKVLDEAVKCRRDKINITTFMIASDPYLQSFVREMTEANKGKAYFASLDNLGGYIFEDYIKNRKKNVK